jgi:hypothetical protein
MDGDLIIVNRRGVWDDANDLNEGRMYDRIDHWPEA